MTEKLGKILVLHGPNLNLLGSREPEHYGHATLAEIDRMLVDQGAEAGLEVDCFQSNSESELIDRIQGASRDGIAFLLINPAAFTHTSVFRLSKCTCPTFMPGNHFALIPTSLIAPSA